MPIQLHVERGNGMQRKTDFSALTFLQFQRRGGFRARTTGIISHRISQIEIGNDR